MSIKGSQQHTRCDDGGEVQEQKVVVVHDLDEVAAGRGVHGRVPAKQWQQADTGTRNPAHSDYH